VDLNIVGGKAIVKEGKIVTVNVPELVRKHNQAAKRLLEG
jgi:hypothetical protein